jgi:site-specific recombinase XerD
MPKQKMELPLPARRFLDTQSSSKIESVIRAFHQWMKEWNLSFQNLRRAHIKSFISYPRGKHLSEDSKNRYRQYLSKYLIWMHDQKPLQFDPKCFCGRQKLTLAKSAAQFICSLEPTHKNSTLEGYRISLRSFHKWLDCHQVPIAQIQRRHTSAWMMHINDKGLAPISRSHHLIYVRVYLRWLYEHSFISSYPDDLVRVSDMPKIPKYLPRPLPSAVDKTLQERLANSSSMYHQGLLLMRQTGLRIGELMSLERDCIRYDQLGNWFLKVPLGKLNNERLVPLNDNSVALIEKLKGNDGNLIGESFLLKTRTGNKTHYPRYAKALKDISCGLSNHEKITTHRLRHTYATTLLNAGMSLVGVMKLLGHRNHQMTLRYTEITQERIAKEYFDALSQLENRYTAVLNNTNSQELNPGKMLYDVIHLIQKLSADDTSSKSATRAIVKRIKRIQVQIEKLNLAKKPEQ